MTKRMLIDATHLEETRVAIVDGTHLEELDIETAQKEQIKGNIYLAKVIRTEPSLQAAFVEYGGNRHGFLAFSEIHPDYYQIPIADKEKLKELMEQERNARKKSDIDEDDECSCEEKVVEENSSDVVENSEIPTDAKSDEDETNQKSEDATSNEAAVENSEIPTDAKSDEAEANQKSEDDNSDVPQEICEKKDASISQISGTSTSAIAFRANTASHDQIAQDIEIIFDISPDEASGAQSVCELSNVASENVESDEIQPKKSENEACKPGKCKQKQDVEDAKPRSPKADIEEIDTETEELIDDEVKKPHFLKNYKIQEVIKKGQIILVQVLKEERGNKGAALTSYMSLAGRYCVLMPNTAHGGGVSRKITNIAERKQLKQMLNELQIPDTMGVIVRTAGKDKDKQEIKRDYDYLIKTWMGIRDKTMKAQAPSLIHEEAGLVKRALRDLYSKDIGEIIIDGEKEYKYAREFMKMLSPNMVKKISLYKNNKLPLFHRYQIENQIAMIHNPIIQLKSGGYLVINQTEALVAIDINSGRATKERTIEETAVKTNLEAAEEIARQLRLRDLSGLVVIDFIDMDEPKNNHAVERKMKEALKKDKARVQVGRISGFGLLEMSRQRIHSSFLEASYNTCPCCNGTGLVRSVASCALSITRIIEEEAYKSQSKLVVTVNPEVALYILNHKRSIINKLESLYSISILVMGDENITKRMDYRIEKIKTQKEETSMSYEIFDNEPEPSIEPEHEPETKSENVEGSEEAGANKKRRSRNNRNFYKKNKRYGNRKPKNGEGFEKSDKPSGGNAGAQPSSEGGSEKKKGWWQRLIK